MVESQDWLQEEESEEYGAHLLVSVVPEFVVQVA